MAFDALHGKVDAQVGHTFAEETVALEHLLGGTSKVSGYIPILVPCMPQSLGDGGNRDEGTPLLNALSASLQAANAYVRRGTEYYQALTASLGGGVDPLMRSRAPGSRLGGGAGGAARIAGTRRLGGEGGSGGGSGGGSVGGGGSGAQAAGAVTTFLAGLSPEAMVRMALPTASGLARRFSLGDDIGTLADELGGAPRDGAATTAANRAEPPAGTLDDAGANDVGDVGGGESDQGGAPRDGAATTAANRAEPPAGTLDDSGANGNDDGVSGGGELERGHESVARRVVEKPVRAKRARPQSGRQATASRARTRAGTRDRA